THANVAGLVDEGIEVRSYMAIDPVSCGSRPDLSSPQIVEANVKRDGDAYYASIFGSPSPYHVSSVLLSLSGNNENTLIVLPVKIPNDIGANSTFLRFDVTKRMVSRYASNGGSKARCLSQL